MKDLKQFIKTTIREFLNEQHSNDIYDKYKNPLRFFVFTLNRKRVERSRKVRCC